MSQPGNYRFPFSTVQRRTDACTLCNEENGHLVGKVDYFHLETFDMVQCPECGLISTDPIPSAEVVEKGCSLLYKTGYGAGTQSEILRGFRKSFRRGASFARKYLADISASNPAISLLEVGAGDGYFSAGIKAEITNTKVWLIDVVKDVVEYYKETHDCVAVEGEFEASVFVNQKFDLVIFRDLLEHVRDPSLFLACVNRAAKPGAKIFFITPNGKEDFWMINQRFIKTGQATLLLLNHFHYFLPETLQKLMIKNGLEIVDGFKFGLKQHRKGLGRKEFFSFDQQKLPTVSTKPLDIKKIWRHNPNQVRRHVLARPGFVSRAYGSLVDHEKKRIDFHSEIGHEFSILATKVSDVPAGTPADSTNTDL